jgi:lipopolysaccharide transport system ATP-binding protein
MGSFAIKVQNVAKAYQISGQKAKYQTLRDSLMAAVKTPFQWLQGGVDQKGETIWALDDISFNVKKGAVVGIIGHNGAGKSTLLKILSRITEPTRGSVDLYGRVGSLLEVGTGFHNELTGRENIFLNGAILGMSRKTIQRKFDEIVAFAEVEKFIDTPVKYYSSGMYLRLAFAVAAHLEPEILLVDEVLAVGDAAFQKKCLGKMGQVAEEGRTVLFVSHDMTNIAVLCEETIWIDHGKLRERGPSRQVIEHYINYGGSTAAQRSWGLADAPGQEIARLRSVRLETPDGTISHSFSLISPIHFVVEFQVLKSGYRLNPVLRLKDRIGAIVFTSSNYEDSQWGKKAYDPGLYQVVCEIPGHILNEGAYHLDLMLIREMRDEEALVNSAVNLLIYDNGETRGDYVGEWVGVVRPRCIWTGDRIDA